MKPELLVADGIAALALPQRDAVRQARQQAPHLRIRRRLTLLILGQVGIGMERENIQARPGASGQHPLQKCGVHMGERTADNFRGGIHRPDDFRPAFEVFRIDLGRHFFAAPIGFVEDFPINHPVLVFLR